MKLVKLADKLTIALGQYYLNRSNSRDTISTVGSGPGYKEYRIKEGGEWDKQKDIERIENSTNLPFSACAGTFWFVKKNQEPFEDYYRNGRDLAFWRIRVY